MVARLYAEGRKFFSLAAFAPYLALLAVNNFIVFTAMVARFYARPQGFFLGGPGAFFALLAVKNICIFTARVAKVFAMDAMNLLDFSSTIPFSSSLRGAT